MTTSKKIESLEFESIEELLVKRLIITLYRSGAEWVDIDNVTILHNQQINQVEVYTNYIINGLAATKIYLPKNDSADIFRMITSNKGAMSL